MKKLSLVFFHLFACTQFVFMAKAQVKNKSFSFVLKNLLSHSVPEMSVEEAAKSQHAYLFLDAREKDEFVVSHIPAAIYVGNKNFRPEALNTIKKNQPLIVYCSIGKRSENIAQKLSKQGYTNVHNLYGGIFEWMNQGHVVYDSENKPTNNIHPYNWLWGRFIDKGIKVYEMNAK